MNKINYYEVEFNDGYSICILGERKPTIEEASVFLKEDCEKIKTIVANVQEIDSDEAHTFFYMVNEANFPIFK